MFEVSADLRTVTCTPAPGIAARSIRHLFLDTVMPLVLSVAAKTVLHASAVAHEGEAILFVGASGRGKSTLASVLATNDGAVLADDAVIVEARADRFVARPTYESLRLRATFDAPPTRESGMLGFCRRCHAQVMRATGDCPDCVAQPIAPFDGSTPTADLKLAQP